MKAPGFCSYINGTPLLDHQSTAWAPPVAEKLRCAEEGPHVSHGESWDSSAVLGPGRGFTGSGLGSRAVPGKGAGGRVRCEAATAAVGQKTWGGSVFTLQTGQPQKDLGSHIQRMAHGQVRATCQRYRAARQESQDGIPGLT